MMKRLLVCLCLCLWSLPARAADTQRGLNADTTSVSTALGALNAACALATSGQVGAGFQLAAGTLVGTIVPEISVDNGATWVATQFDDPVTSNKVSSIAFASSNTATTRAIVLSGGTRQVRVRVSLYTSGTANCTIVSSAANDPSSLFAGQNGAAVPPTVIQSGGVAKSVLPAPVADGTLVPNMLSTDGALYVRVGSPALWHCSVTGIAASLTQCQAAPAAGSLYITSIFIQTTTTTSGTFALQAGTGAACVTGTTAIFPASGTGNRFNAPVSTAGVQELDFITPIKLTALNALCVIGVATNTIDVDAVGFTAP